MNPLTWVQLFRLLPEVLELVKYLAQVREKRAPNEGPLKTKEMKQALKGINEAFKYNDSEKLNKVFNSL